MSGINRIDIPISGTSSTAASQRDQALTILIGLGNIGFDNYHYTDTNSGNGHWGYYAIGYGYANGDLTIVTVTCTGMTNPPSGSNRAASSDPGPGSLYTWAPIGAPPVIKVGKMASGDHSSMAQLPSENSNFIVWQIAGNAPTAATDFTNAILKLAQIANNFNYYKYVDSVSGAWSVYAITEQNNSAGGSPFYSMVTCHGTPKPPTGSVAPAVSIPAFTQSFTAISCPIMLRPSR
jgi:hypothetical protein